MKQAFLISAILLLVQCSSEPSPIILKNVPFDAQTLLSLESFGKVTYEESSRWLVLAYVPTLSCQTCTNRDLQYLATMEQRLREMADFALICNPGNREYVRNIRRVTKIKFPILIEKQEASLGLAQHFHFLLIDKANNQSVVQFFTASTLPLDQGMIPFEEKILEFIKDS